MLDHKLFARAVVSLLMAGSVVQIDHSFTSEVM